MMCSSQSSQQSQKLPDTCPSIPSQNSQCSQPVAACLPWGFLFPTNPKLKWLALFGEEYVIGRAPQCHLVLGEEIDPARHAQLSKQHFRVRRALLNNLSDLMVVHLDDLSFNGTYINGKKLGKGRSAVLRNNDVISLAISSFEAFIYMDKDPDIEVRCYPDEVLNKYAICKKLGSGAYGEVRLVYEKETGEAYAMKIIQKNKFLPDEKKAARQPVRVEREIKILKKLSHDFVIKFHDALDYPQSVFLVVELVRGGELFSMVEKRALRERDAKFIFFQLALAVRYLHLQGIIHRDVKLENILLSSSSEDPIIKLADFGLSKFLDSESLLKTMCGTPMYIAPEVLKSEGRPGSYDTQADIWSMGVVLYMCLSGIAPFLLGDKKLPLSRQILTGYYSFPRKNWKTVSYNAIHLVKKMLVVDPKRRITIEQILNHPWLKDPELKKRLSTAVKSDMDCDLINKENIADEESDDHLSGEIEVIAQIKRAGTEEEKDLADEPKAKRPRISNSEDVPFIHARPKVQPTVLII